MLIATRVHSSVARAADCRSAGPWFKSGCALCLLHATTSLYPYSTLVPRTSSPSHSKSSCAYTRPGSNWRPSACWADVIATRPRVPWRSRPPRISVMQRNLPLQLKYEWRYATCASAKILVRRRVLVRDGHKTYTWPGSNWRPSACEADVIATRPQVPWRCCPSPPRIRNTGAHATWRPKSYTRPHLNARGPEKAWENTPSGQLACIDEGVPGGGACRWRMSGWPSQKWMTLAGLEPAIFGSEFQRLIH